MPILDISLQFSLCANEKNYRTKLKTVSYLRFFLDNLLKASKYLYRNVNTIEAAIQFKKDLINSISFVNKHFECNLTISKDFNDPTLIDYYSYFYEKVNSKYKTNDILDDGKYYCYKFEKGFYKIKIFKPKISFNYVHSWLFTDSPIAILCITDQYITDEQIDDSIQFINLEIDLYQALGFTLVLCVFSSKMIFFLISILHKILKIHNFSEIHFNIQYNDVEQFTSFVKNLLHIYDSISGYCYLYSQYYQNESNELKNFLSRLKNKPRFKKFTYSGKIGNVIYVYEITKIPPFNYCGNGFDIDKIRIHLCNIPLYDSNDSQKGFSTSKLSGNTSGYILSNDFLYFNNFRVNVLVNDLITKEVYGVEEKIGSILIQKFVDFEDIHLMKMDFFIEDNIYLANIASESLKKSQIIYIDYRMSFDDFKEKKFSILFKNKNIKKKLVYASQAYSFYQIQFKDTFKIHLNQILAAYEACKICINNKSNDDKGVIYQLETGEGKSCTISLIAAVLALSKKTVHIASSNIILANRDYCSSLGFFKLLGIKSAVLLHKNEFTKDKTLYPDIFFKDELFNNKSNMNFSICGINNDNTINKNKADVIFSTFVHFENLYFRLMEMCPGFLNNFFNDCSLIIDEADSILIDELTTGTILSRSIKSNSNEVLKYVYKCWLEKRDPKNVYNDVKKQWPMCKDIQIEDIEMMYKEIHLVNQVNFTNGNKYSIEQINDNNNKNIIQKGKELINDINKKIDNFQDKIVSKIVNGTSLNIDKNNINEQQTKQIIPFDSNHKGILEPNKEFNGFIQQFIAIKEMFNSSNEDIYIKDISINYLYISHPIFIKLYNGICGFTGTIGNKYDKEIFKKQYHLQTKKIPRNNPNFRVEFPILLCKNIKERNQKIVSEILEFNKIKCPVLVIFRDLNEINAVKEMLFAKDIQNINIFEGKNNDKNLEDLAGNDGAISLGTNVCGRGASINSSKPLHVIVSYYSSNARIMDQAYGRTARQGQKGSVRVICLLEQYISPKEKYRESDLNSILKEFKSKNIIQEKFIKKYQENRKWIFNPFIQKQKIKPKDIIEMRSSRINVNRMKAYNFEYPICISISSFLEIQSQKIYSLYNCPNCKYTWMLFQQYVREMILESWSLFINRIENNFIQKKTNKTFDEYIESELDNLYKQLNIYLPFDSENSEKVDIISTFMHIFNLVKTKYETVILKSFPNNITDYFKQSNNNSISLCIGFRPYSLTDESGARINTLGNSTQSQNYIKDPELKYMRKQPNGKLSLLSITEKIDDIFDWMCNTINNKLGSYIGLKFFMRRTLGGCEFGICFDFELENIDKELMNNYNCIVDKDSLLLFVITVKSPIPMLAGFLIFWAIYIGSVIKKIAEYISAFSVKAAQAVLKTLKNLVETLGSNALNRCCVKICDFLNRLLDQQIDKMKTFDSKAAQIFSTLKTIITSKDFSGEVDIGENIFKMFVGNVFIKKNLPMNNFLKIGFLLLLCFASFMMLFKMSHKQAIFQKPAEKYNKTNNLHDAINENNNLVKIDQSDP